MPTSEAGKLALEQLRVLRASYAKGLPDKLNHLKSLWQRLRAQNEPDAKTLDTLRLEVHRLAGSGASYGYTRLSGVMQSIEQKLDQWRDFPEDGTSIVVELDRQFASLERYTQPDDEPELPVTVVSTRDKKTDRLSLVLLAPDDEDARALRTLMAQFGFSLNLLHDPDDIPAIAEARPDLLLIEQSVFSASLIQRLRQRLETLPFIIVFAPNPTLMQRVELYRRGVMTVLPWPPDCPQLITEIENCFGDMREVPFRVLLVDDDVELSLYYAQVLSSAGMLTRVTSDPWDVQAALEEFRPDVILMDLYMPEVNGIELANAIRQEPACFGIPIIFASVEKDIVRHIGPIRAGGDDFLVKPVPVPFLIASVETRARRGRELRRMVNRDGLTGLLNHVALEEALQREVARAERNETPLAFVMIDLDHFKRINDTYGHLMGDRVLVDFAHLLRNRLRRSDIIGRYGGEEFSVILPDTELEEAFVLIDQLRQAFGQVTHQMGAQSVQVTFSAGIAPWLPGMSAETLRQQADRALYQAKASGRNCIEIYRSQD